MAYQKKTIEVTFSSQDRQAYSIQNSAHESRDTGDIISALSSYLSLPTIASTPNVLQALYPASIRQIAVSFALYDWSTFSLHLYAKAFIFCRLFFFRGTHILETFRILQCIISGLYNTLLSPQYHLSQGVVLHINIINYMTFFLKNSTIINNYIKKLRHKVIFGPGFLRVYDLVHPLSPDSESTDEIADLTCRVLFYYNQCLSTAGHHILSSSFI